MKKDLVELVFILDKSGSMSGLETDTIGGFNSLLEKQKKEPGEVILSLVLFDTKISVIYDRVNIKDVSQLTSKEYYAGGCTALLDAVGITINHINHVHESLDDKLKPEKTVFFITTDGYENSSDEYSYSKVKELISDAKKKDYEFIFLGANIDSIEEASKIGIDKDFAATYKHDSKGVRKSMKVMSNVVYSISKKMKIDKDWKKGLCDESNDEIIDIPK